jgi:hypothetical protein
MQVFNGYGLSLLVQSMDRFWYDLSAAWASCASTIGGGVHQKPHGL